MEDPVVLNSKQVLKAAVDGLIVTALFMIGALVFHAIHGVGDVLFGVALGVSYTLVSVARGARDKS